MIHTLPLPLETFGGGRGTYFVSVFDRNRVELSVASTGSQPQRFPDALRRLRSPSAFLKDSLSGISLERTFVTLFFAAQEGRRNCQAGCHDCHPPVPVEHDNSMPIQVRWGRNLRIWCSPRITRSVVESHGPSSKERECPRCPRLLLITMPLAGGSITRIHDCPR